MTGTSIGRRMRAIIALLLDTRIRVGELCSLHLCGVGLAAGEITIIPTTDTTRQGRTIMLRRNRLASGRSGIVGC